MRRMLVGGLFAAAMFGCKMKTTPDMYMIDCNVKYARVRVYDDDRKLLSEHFAGETFAKFDEDGTVRVTADGYYDYDGPVSDLESMGKRSWFVTLRRKLPGDQGGQ